jgi:hypothetical protein
MSAEARLDWSYAQPDANVAQLCQRALSQQWDADTAIDWSASVDPERPFLPETHFPLYGSELYAQLPECRQRALRVEAGRFLMSQLLHGEQGGLLACAQVVLSAPDLGCKLFASLQVADEARHVRVFDRLVRDKLGGSYPVSDELDALLRLILEEPRWDMKVLGVNVVLEGLALSTLATLQRISLQPLVAQIAQHVLRDEARHCSFSTHALCDRLGSLSEAELREREDFVYEIAALLLQRMVLAPVFERAGLDVARCTAIAWASPHQLKLRRMLFAHVIRTLQRIGLWSQRMRARLCTLGLLEEGTDAR